ncbi:lytic transglycosylase domain-containing protein [Mesorhizobium sp.]|uniref:lytic transglycosylase domain-containing protein n=1 Tax=Mesorhizobium sp. TaxID=1871066 RepID=UPI0025C339C5|nr:lytic transglycosylase domain-containing protein [Mesorhizobium sp.]
MLALRFSCLAAASPLIDRAAVKPFVPIARETAASHSGGQEAGARPSLRTLIASTFGGSRASRRSLALDGTEHGGSLMVHWPCEPYAVICQGITALCACAMLTVSMSAVCAEPPTHNGQPARSNSRTSSPDPWSAHIREAAKRFAIPERLLRAVMHVESVGDVHAVSSKGAMGLMQIMPGTWEELRIKHHLGDDPYQPRDNILAGAAYLREMLDRFGRKGFLAAYNAGPGRYQEHLLTGRPLPRETIDYVRKLAPVIRDAVSIPPRERQGANRASVLHSSVFVQNSDIGNVAAAHGERSAHVGAEALFAGIHLPAMRTSTAVSVVDLTAVEPQPDETGSASKPSLPGLFVQRSPLRSR